MISFAHKTLFFSLLIGICFLLPVEKGYSQTNPKPYPLSSTAGTWAFDTWLNTTPAGQYVPTPTTAATCNGIWHRCTDTLPVLATLTNADYTGVYSASATSSRIQGLGASGFGFLNIAGSGDNNLGAFVLGLNTTGYNNINVAYKIQSNSNGAKYNVRLQYRPTTAAAWQDVPGPIEYVGDGLTDGATWTVQSVNLNVIVGADNKMENRANAQLRWKYYYTAGTGNSERIAIDSIRITSTAIGNAIACDLVSTTTICVTGTSGTSISVPFSYVPSASFTNGTAVFNAQLSDAAGSFAFPTNIGSITSNASGYQTIAATIPAGTPSGSGYRIRVICAAPSVTGNDNDQNITIKLSPVNVSATAASCGVGSSLVSWTMPNTATSCYDEVLVVAYPLVPTVGSPTGDGTAYTANASYGLGTAFGAGYVVYKGTGTSVTVSNLTNSSLYYFKVWTRYGTSWSGGQEVSCTPEFTGSTKLLINGYLNAASTFDEWTELIVTQDNLDLRGWKIRDNSAGDNWQTDITFSSNAKWQHVRRGTIIMLWSRDIDFSSVPHPMDSVFKDGYLELYLYKTASAGYSFFTGGGSSSMDLNTGGNGDIIEVRDASNTHVHGVGHASSPGASWTAMPTPKMNHSGSVSNGDAVSVCPGGNYTAYDAPSGNTYTATSNVAATYGFGLPNSCASSSTANAAFWQALRQPDFTTQSVSFTALSGGSPGSASFSWTAATDPYPADSTTGYIILRNTSNSFLSPPIDGTDYVVGNVIGGATVVGIINHSATTSFTDNSVYSGNKYWYRIYAFRFKTDDYLGTGFASPTVNAARGRAYNETNFVSVNWTSSTPLPVELLRFEGYRKETANRLQWETASEINSDYFLLERSKDGKNFDKLARISAAGNSNNLRSYGFDDVNPGQGITYYGLTQFDLDGRFSGRRVIAIQPQGQLGTLPVQLYPNPASTILYLDLPSDASASLRYSLFDCIGKEALTREIGLSEGFNHLEIDLNKLASGTYFLHVQSGDRSFRTPIVKR